MTGHTWKKPHGALGWGQVQRDSSLMPTLVLLGTKVHLSLFPKPSLPLSSSSTSAMLCSDGRTPEPILVCVWG